VAAHEPRADLPPSSRPLSDPFSFLFFFTNLKSCYSYERGPEKYAGYRNNLCFQVKGKLTGARGYSFHGQRKEENIPASRKSVRIDLTKRASISIQDAWEFLPMKNMLADRFSVGAGLVGMALAIATLATGANPVEGSVITPFLRETTVGNVILFVLIITSLPAMLIADLPLAALWKLGVSVPVPLGDPLYMAVLQGTIYFCLAKLVLFCMRRIKRV
jgi:hypothetical protein